MGIFSILISIVVLILSILGFFPALGVIPCVIGLILGAIGIIFAIIYHFIAKKANKKGIVPLAMTISAEIICVIPLICQLAFFKK